MRKYKLLPGVGNGVEVVSFFEISGTVYRSAARHRPCPRPSPLLHWLGPKRTLGQTTSYPTIPASCPMFGLGHTLVQKGGRRQGTGSGDFRHGL